MLVTKIIFAIIQVAMRNLLDQLYKTKLQLLAVICTVSGIATLVLARGVDASTTAHWLGNLPLTDIGSALFTTGLLAIAFEYIDRKDADERATQRLRTVLREEAPAIRDAVYDSFAFNAPALKNIASPDTITKIIQNGLALQLKDDDLARSVYDDLRQQVIETAERRYDVHVSVALAPWQDGPPTGRGAMFIATIRWQYRVTNAGPTMRFACVSDPDEYRELLRDPTSTTAWYFEPITGLDGSSPETFELLQCTVDGTARPIRRTKRKGSQLFTVGIDNPANAATERTISYTYRVLIQQNSHMLFLDLPRPAHGLQVELWYGDSGIQYVNALDFIAGPGRVQILRTPGAVPTPSIDISYDSWTFAKSGVVFVWVLESELERALPTITKSAT